MPTIISIVASQAVPRVVHIAEFLGPATLGRHGPGGRTGCGATARRRPPDQVSGVLSGGRGACHGDQTPGDVPGHGPSRWRSRHLSSRCHQLRACSPMGGPVLARKIQEASEGPQLRHLGGHSWEPLQGVWPVVAVERRYAVLRPCPGRVVSRGRVLSQPMRACPELVKALWGVARLPPSCLQVMTGGGPPSFEGDDRRRATFARR